MLGIACAETLAAAGAAHHLIPPLVVGVDHNGGVKRLLLVLLRCR
jgi:hypothetical protein